LFYQQNTDSLKRLLNKSDDAQKYKILIRLSHENLLTDPAESKRYSEEAEKVALRLKDEKELAQAHQDIGMYNARTGNLSSALNNLNKALEILKKIQDDKESAVVENNIAGVYLTLKRYDAALNIYRKLLSYYYETGALERYCAVLNNVGTIYNSRGNYEKAVENYKDILSTLEKNKFNDEGFLAVVYCNLGESYFGIGDFVQSLTYRKMSLDIYNMQNHKDGIANLQMDIASSFIKLEDFPSAKQYLIYALKNYQELKYPEGIRNTLKIFISLYDALGKPDMSLAVCRELEGLCIAAKDSFMLQRCYNKYAEIYFIKRNYKEAAEYFAKGAELKKRLESRVDKARETEMQAIFEIEEKEYENKLLRHENELQKEKIKTNQDVVIVISAAVILAIMLIIAIYRKEKRIKKINEQIKIKNNELEEHIVSKDKFFSILAHNLKNPFWAVLGQVKLLETDYDELTDEDRRELISQTGIAAQNVYKLFDDLLQWARSQQNAIGLKKENLNVNELLTASVKPYISLAKNKEIEIIVNCDPSLNVFADKFMIETVIGNLVDNAIKFSNKESSIYAAGIIDGSFTELTVKDSGLGISAEKLEKLFKIGENVTSEGTMNERGTGLGLIICMEFVKKHGGNLTVESVLGSGTTFKVVLPVN